LGHNSSFEIEGWICLIAVFISEIINVWETANLEHECIRKMRVSVQRFLF
jgi:hypothetical protein